MKKSVLFLAFFVFFTIDSFSQKDFTFCYGSISVTMFGGGNAEMVRYNSSGSIVSRVTGTFDLYGVGNPTEVLKIQFQGNEYRYDLIRDGYGNPSKIFDNQGREYNLCKTSKSSSNNNYEPPTKEQYKNAINPNFIIGKYITVGKIVVAEENFSDEMDWKTAKEFCSKLGEGWRLPTKEELWILCLNSEKIGGFNEDRHYWSSTEYDTNKGSAWMAQTGFGLGMFPGNKSKLYYVRAVRSFYKTEETTGSAFIIGKPITIGNLLVAENDFPKGMKWDDAKKACTALGEGWRLPSKDELDILYKNRNKIGVFTNNNYWSSTEIDQIKAWRQWFQWGLQADLNKADSAYVRAVRTI